MNVNSSISTEEPIFQPLCAIFRRFLKRQGHKFTPERAMILDAVLGKKSVFEADELLEEMRAGGHRVSKATIYRTLKHLMESRIINEVLIDSTKAHYELCYGREQKGHLVCVETNKIIEFATPVLKELRDQICKQYGYEPVSYRFVIYGVSPEAKMMHDDESET